MSSPLSPAYTLLALEGRELESMLTASVSGTKRLLEAVGKLPQGVAPVHDLLVHHVAVRKKYFEKIARASLEGGFEQAVFLGVGWDSLSFRLASDYPQVEVVELELVPMGLERRKAMEKLEWNAPNHKLSLSENGRWNGSEWNPEYRTLFVAEGVFMYLEPPQVRDLVVTFHRHSRPGSRLLFSYIGDRRGGWGDEPGVSSWSLVSKYLRWTTECPEEFLNDLGWRLLSRPLPQDLSRDYLASLGKGLGLFSEIERFCLVESTGRPD